MPQSLHVLVTGANGFLGRHVVMELLRRHHRVRALVRPTPSLAELPWRDEVEFYRADLRAGSDLVSAFDDIDVLIHLAAAVGGDEETQFATAVVGTERLLEAMARSTTKKLVLASSLSVYNWQNPLRVLDEHTPIEMGRLYERDGYAVAKVWQERVTRRFAQKKNWELVVLRPGFIWGNGNDYVPGLGASVGPVHIVIAPLGRLPLTYVENCAQAFAAAADTPDVLSQTVNVIDDDSVRSWQFVGEWMRTTRQRGFRFPLPYWLGLAITKSAQAMSKRIFRGKGKLPSILIPIRFQARFRPLRYDYGKVRRVLRWKPTFDFEEALQKTRSEGSAAISLD